MELTREEAISKHRKMWNWIADRIEEEKEYQDIEDLKIEYCDREGFDDIENNCFCCEYTNCVCEFCPIKWESKVENYMCVDKYKEDDYEGIYWICCDEEDWKEQAKLARQIANLPERENV